MVSSRPVAFQKLRCTLRFSGLSEALGDSFGPVGEPWANG